MKFFKTVIAAAAMVASAVAVALPQGAGVAGPNAFTSPAGGATVGAEGVVNVAWTPGPPGTVSIWLIKGPENAMVDLVPVATNIPNNGAFTWTPSKELQDSSTITNGDKYAFRIVDDSSQATNYSPPFGLTVPGSTFGPAPPAAPSAAPTTAAPAAPSTDPSSVAPISSAAPSDATSAVSSAAPSAITSAPVNSPTTTAASTATSSPTTSSTPPPVTDAPEKNNGPNIGLIIGAVFGAVAGIGLLVVAVMIFLKKRKEHQREQAIKNLDREHALQRVSEVQREWMSQYEQGGKPPARSPSTGGLSVGIGKTEKSKRASSFMGTAF